MSDVYQRLPARRSRQVIHILSDFKSYEALYSSYLLTAVPQPVLGHCWDAAGDRFLRLRPHLNLIPDASGSLGAAAAPQAAQKQFHDCGNLHRCPSHLQSPVVCEALTRLDIALFAASSKAHNSAHHLSQAYLCCAAEADLQWTGCPEQPVLSCSQRQAQAAPCQPSHQAPSRSEETLHVFAPSMESFPAAILLQEPSS